MTPFDKAFRKTIGLEGDFSDHPADLGGATRFGITTATARGHGYFGPMEDLPLATAEQIYRAQYWDAQRCDELAAESARLAEEIFDTSVNCGLHAAGRWLQRSLNALNHNERWFSDLRVDGLIGPITIIAVKQHLVARGGGGERVLLRALNCLQGAHYIDISEKRPANQAFTFGWLLHRVVI